MLVVLERAEPPSWGDGALHFIGYLFVFQIRHDYFPIRIDEQIFFMVK